MKSSTDPIEFIIATAKLNLRNHKRPVIPPELLEQRISNHMRTSR